MQLSILHKSRKSSISEVVRPPQDSTMDAISTAVEIASIKKPHKLGSKYGNKGGC